jgi:hypothetical protein
MSTRYILRVSFAFLTLLLFVVIAFYLVAVAPVRSMEQLAGSSGSWPNSFYLPAVPIQRQGLSWEEVGIGSASGRGISNNDGLSADNSIAVAPNGIPYISWTDLSSGNPEIYVRHWSNGLWQEVGSGSATGGGISNTPQDSVGSSLAIGSDEIPYVSWENRISTNEYAQIYVRRWNGSSWQEVGSGSASGGGISTTPGHSGSPATAVSLDDVPYVAWIRYNDGNSDVYVRRWNGSEWEEVGLGSASGGGISNSPGNSGSPSVAIAPDGTPYIAWMDESGGDREIYVRRWNGSSWEEVGTGSATGGGISDNSGQSENPSLAVSPAGTPYIAWNDNSYSNFAEIYVRRWNGSSWEEVGIGSASGSGISNGESNSEWPSLAISPNDVPYIAWHGYNPVYDMEIYVRRWNGNSWEEVGVSSATGFGISNTVGESMYSAVAVSADGIPYVTWRNCDNNGDCEIYVRYWLGQMGWEHR